MLGGVGGGGGSKCRGPQVVRLSNTGSERVRMDKKNKAEAAAAAAKKCDFLCFLVCTVEVAVVFTFNVFIKGFVFGLFFVFFVVAVVLFDRYPGDGESGLLANLTCVALF